MKTIERIVLYLTSEVRQPHQIRLFTILTYSWFIVNAMMVWNVRNFLWDTENVFFRQGHADTFIENFIYQLVYAPSRFRFVFYAHIVCAALSIANWKWSIVPRLLTWITALMLYYAAAEAFNSGMMIMMLSAFYGAFMYTGYAPAWRNIITNLAFIGAMLQVILVYATAAAYKLGGEQWLDGSAVYYSLQIDKFSSAFWHESGLIHSMVLMKTLNYFALGYQTIFPLIIWVKKLRKWFLLIGVLFHLFIGFFMHLYDFALAMIFVYALFLEDGIAIKICSWLRLNSKKTADIT